MKKIKISELPLQSSLKGLYTIGTNSQDQSVKVSLEFVETTTAAAVSDALKATTVTKEATNNANIATRKAEIATTNADTATQETNTAKTNAIEATNNATTATTNANNAAESALAAKTNITAMLQRLIPTGLEVSCLGRITVSNLQPVYVKASLTPTDAIHNIIYISDNRACFVTTDGRIRVLSEGVSTIQVIPTCNTALAKTITIEVSKPFARLNTSQSLRFTSAKNFRFT